jgi:rubrerythrin
MSVCSTPESARAEIEQLAKALVESWHNDPEYKWHPDYNGVTFDELIVNYYRCYQCSHEWVDVYPAEPDDVCPRCGADVPPYKSHAYAEADESSENGPLQAPF